MKELERLLKALASKRRLAILRHLKNHEKDSVGNIAREIGLSFKATSQHLGKLVTLDILESEQKGIMVFYNLSSSQKSVVKYILSML